MLTSTKRVCCLLAGLLFVAACQSAPEALRTDLEARIKRVEQSLIAIDASGQDNGVPQPISTRMAALKVPGLGIAIFDEGRIIWTGSYGVRDQATQKPVDAKTLFQAASISKPLSSTALFRLVEHGDLKLDEDVNDRLRGWKVPENELTVTEKVTPRRIITHMAGLGVHGFVGYAPEEALPTLGQILDGAPPANSSPVRVETVPGSVESYSGGGFMVLQLLMQEASGRAFADLLSELVLRPVGMSNSTFVQPLPAGLLDRATTGHDEKGMPIPGRFRINPELAAAGLWTTPTDLAKFMLAIGRSYRGEPNGLLSQSSARTMLTKVPGGSGQGFGLSGEGEAFRYRHSGGNIGFRAYAVAFAGSGRGVVLMANSDAGGQLMHEVARAISREYGWPPLWMGD